MWSEYFQEGQPGRPGGRAGCTSAVDCAAGRSRLKARPAKRVALRSYQNAARRGYKKYDRRLLARVLLAEGG
jgi:hypothetical protein